MPAGKRTRSGRLRLRTGIEQVAHAPHQLIDRDRAATVCVELRAVAERHISEQDVDAGDQFIDRYRSPLIAVADARDDLRWG
jgi:hypothetical protein